MSEGLWMTELLLNRIKAVLTFLPENFTLPVECDSDNYTLINSRTSLDQSSMTSKNYAIKFVFNDKLKKKI